MGKGDGDHSCRPPMTPGLPPDGASADTAVLDGPPSPAAVLDPPPSEPPEATEQPQPEDGQGEPAVAEPALAEREAAPQPVYESVHDLLDRYAEAAERGEDVVGAMRVMVIDTQEKKTKRGQPYDLVTVRDRSGELVVRDFRRHVRAAESPQFCRVKVKVETYQDQPSAILEGCRPIDDADLDPDDFINFDREANERHRVELREVIDAIDPESPAGHVARAVFSDEDTFERFCSWPAATRFHHNYKGGLVEHTLEVLRMAHTVAAADGEPYDHDLVTAGALLHDIGKLDEYNGPPIIGYNRAGGRLAYHLAHGQVRLGMAVQRARDTGHDVPEWAVWKLTHIIEQSHGANRLDQGRDPVGKEARAIAMADDLSAHRVPDDREQDTISALRDLGA